MDGQKICGNLEKLKESFKNLNKGLEQSDAVKKSVCRATVILGLLCLLLLVGHITLLVLYPKNNLRWEKEMMQLQTSNNNLAKENEQLKNKLEDVPTDIQRKLQDLYSQGWVSDSGSFYLISSSQKSWQESRNDCLQRGADLVVINNREKQQFIRKLKKPIWIGLTDSEKEGKWKWVDGTPLTTSYWAPGEPNGNADREEDCVDIKNYDLETSWNDEICDLEKYWICEKKLP